MTVANFIKAMNRASLEQCYDTKKNVTNDPERLKALEEIIKVKEELKRRQDKPVVVEEIERMPAKVKK